MLENNTFWVDFFDNILMMENKREKLVSLMILTGYNRSEIADALRISPQAVSKIKKSLRTRLQKRC